MGKVKIYSLYGCNTECEGYKERRKFMEIQSGWTADGRRNMVAYPDLMSQECRYDRFKTDIKCKGCRNMPEKVYKPEG